MTFDCFSLAFLAASVLSVKPAWNSRSFLLEGLHRALLCGCLYSRCGRVGLRSSRNSLRVKRGGVRCYIFGCGIERVSFFLQECRVIRFCVREFRVIVCLLLERLQLARGGAGIDLPIFERNLVGTCRNCMAVTN